MQHPLPLVHVLCRSGRVKPVSADTSFRGNSRWRHRSRGAAVRWAASQKGGPPEQTAHTDKATPVRETLGQPGYGITHASRQVSRRDVSSSRQALVGSEWCVWIRSVRQEDFGPRAGNNQTHGNRSLALRSTPSDPHCRLTSPDALRLTFATGYR